MWSSTSCRVENDPMWSLCDIWPWQFPTMIGTKVEEEQGRWAAQAALRIIDGVPPAHIPLVKTREGRLIPNLRIAERLGAVFPPALLRKARIIE